MLPDALLREIQRLSREVERLKSLTTLAQQTYVSSTWTPTITQSGAVTCTVTRAVYTLLGALVHTEVVLAVTGAGTIANAIKIGGQPAAIQAAAGRTIGSFMLLDAGTAYYVGAVYINGVTDWQFFVHNAGSAVGTAPSFALANNDVIRFDCVYEVP